MSLYGIPNPKDLVGKRMIWHYHPIEFFCPECYFQFFTEHQPMDIEVTILKKVDKNMYCGTCHAKLNHEGWYIVDRSIPMDGMTYRSNTQCVPWTVLSEVEVES